MNNLVLINIDKIISGDLEKGILAGDTIVVRDGLFSEIGFENESIKAVLMSS